MPFGPWKRKFCWWPIVLRHRETKKRKLYWFRFIEQREFLPDTLSGCYTPDDYVEYRAQ